jgi:molecular chaperone HtpG
MEFIQKNSTQYETYNYSADTANVMSILVKSIYTNRDIFLRELISNASDGIDKVCFIDGKYNLDNKIVISYNPESHQITIQDSGCGITKKDLITKIGSIATSGTKQFMEAIAQSKDKLIGQFGVGFYSVYLVAKSIQIITKPVQEPNKTYEWVSQSESTYSIRELVEEDFAEQKDFVKQDFTRGTIIRLTLKEDSYEYLEQDKLIEIIKTHSSYIEHPIYFEKHETKKDENGKYLDEKEKVLEKMNWIPLWAKPKSTISEQDYINFYLHNIKDNLEQHVKEPPVLHKHFNVEGAVNFTGLLYIPAKAPFNLFEPSKRGQSLKLYTKNVLITADHADLYPKWMEFVKGVVETSDIELNVSRQTVQNTKKLRKIYNQLVKKVVEMMEELAENEEQYNKFYREFSCSIKNGVHEEFSREGIHDDSSDRMTGNQFAKRMMKLLRFNTSLGRFIGFDDYVKSMKPSQKAIYYIAGDKKESLELSPFMDKLKDLGLEVLYFEEPIDEYIKGFLTEYKINEYGDGDIIGIHDQGFERFKEPDLNDLNTKTFVDVTRDKLLLTSELKKNINIEKKFYIKLNNTQSDELCVKLKQLYESIGIKFFEVKADEKFYSVPAIIVNHVHLSAQLEKLLNNNAATKRNEQYKPVFERKDMLISKSNKITQYFYEKLCVQGISLDDPEIVDKARTIYTCALIAGGYEPDNAFRFIKKVNELFCLSF